MSLSMNRITGLHAMVTRPFDILYQFSVSTLSLYFFKGSRNFRRHYEGAKVK